MNVEFKDIKPGPKQLRLNRDDKIKLFGVDYMVFASGHDGKLDYWLSNLTGDNSEVFKILNMTSEEVESLIKAITTDYNYRGQTSMFPEFHSLEDLTKFVYHLMLKSPYKVGDKVKILPLKYSHSGSEYPCGVCGQMPEFSGRIVTINRITPACYQTLCKYGLGDPNSYQFEEVAYNWDSSCFRAASAEEIRQVEQAKEPKEPKEPKKEDKPVPQKVTYSMLKDDGYILKEDDELLIHGIKYKVHPKCFLYAPYTYNDRVFAVLGMSGDEVKELALKYGLAAIGDFPCMKSMEALSKFVIAIYEKSPYKVGDTVRVKERQGDGGDYPFYFTRDMAELAGKLCKITEIVINNHKGYESRSMYNGSIHAYILDGVESFCWHESMFERVDKVEEEPVKPCESIKSLVSSEWVANAKKYFEGRGDAGGEQAESEPETLRLPVDTGNYNIIL